jgi:peptidoglycan hydrolase-like protein with peptidoglycan-binding domain
VANVTHWDDVASYQGAYAPTRFVVAKATQSTNYYSPYFEGVKERAAAGKHHFAAYHFLVAGNASAQAKWAYSKIGKVPTMLDIEINPADKKFPSIADSVEFVTEFRALGGTLNISYIPRWFWSAPVGQSGWHSVTMAPLAKLGIKNINSNYGVGSNPGANNAAMKAFGGLPVIGLQYTSTPHDMNLAYMTFAQLWEFWTGAAPVVKPAHQPGTRQLVLATPQLTGPDVLFAQQHIGKAHIAEADGEYGPNTVSGVQWWQKQHNIHVDGEVGPQTWSTFGVKYTGP